MEVYFIYPIPNEVFLYEIIPHLTLEELLPVLITSKFWYSRRNEIYRYIKLPGMAFDLYYNKRQFQKIVPNLQNINIEHYTFNKNMIGIESIGLLPTLKSIDIIDDHLYSNYTRVYEMQNVKNIKKLVFRNPDIIYIYPIVDTFSNLQELILDGVEGTNILGSHQNNFFVRHLGDLQQLKRLCFNVESHNRIWDFSHLTLEEFYFKNFSLTTSTINGTIVITDTPAIITLKLPSAKRIYLNMGSSEGLVEQLIKIKPEKVTHIFVFNSDRQDQIFEQKLREHNIKVICGTYSEEYY